jgi:hypothetical protein
MQRKGMCKISQLENYKLSLMLKMKMKVGFLADVDLWIYWIFKVQPQRCAGTWILGSNVQLQDFWIFWLQMGVKSIGTPEVGRTQGYGSNMG